MVYIKNAVHHLNCVPRCADASLDIILMIVRPNLISVAGPVEYNDISGLRMCKAGNCKNGILIFVNGKYCGDFAP